jgi:tellurite resistance protein TehA-like permease
MTWNSLRKLFVVWFGAAVVRVILGSSTSPGAYFFLGLSWLLSAVLLVVAIRVIMVVESKEVKIAALSIVVAMAAVLGQGLLGSKDTIAIATALFFSSLAVFGYVYVRTLRNGSSVEL